LGRGKHVRRGKSPVDIRDLAQERPAEARHAVDAGVRDGATAFPQGFLADEWGPFVAALRRPLPITFRVSAVASRSSAVAECLERGRPFLYPKEGSAMVYDLRGRVVPPPQPLSWAGGWQVCRLLLCSAFSHVWHTEFQLLAQPRVGVRPTVSPPHNVLLMCLDGGREFGPG